MFYRYLVFCFFLLYSISCADALDDYYIITDIVRAMSVNDLMNTVFDLQENRDLNSPGNSYKSRYCLRVRDTSDPSDQACDNAADYIFQRFASYGLEVEYDPFIHNVKDQGSYRMTNVVATLPGKGPDSDKIYIICSHYDCTAGLSAGWMSNWKTLPAPGADDNASGTAVVLEAARILSNYNFNFTIKFITFSGEELGMFGSKHYAADAFVLGYKVAGVIDLDMIGYDPNDPDIDIVTNEDSQWLANAILYSGNTFNIPMGLNKISNPRLIYSDHSSFWKSGYNAVMLTEGSDNYSDEFTPINHTADDTADKLNLELLLRTSKLAIAALAQLADPITGSDDAVYPDLAVETEVFSSIPLEKGDVVKVTANVRNYGPGDVTGASVQIWLIPPEIGSAPKMLKEWILDMKVNDLYTVSAPLALYEWGNYDVVVRVNSDFRVLESNFTNNLARKTIYISAELGIADLMVYPNPITLGEEDKVTLKYKLSQDAFVIMDIYDILGDLIYSEKFSSDENGGQRGPNNSIKWNCKNQSQNIVTSGTYICSIRATNSSGKTCTAFKKLAVIH